MRKKHRATLEAVFNHPVRANIAWRDVEALFRGLGADVSEGSGSRVRLELHGGEAVFHRPHPEKEAGKASVRDVREFLRSAGVTP